VENRRCHTVGTVSKPNRKIVETVAKRIPITHIDGHLLSWLGTGTSINKSRLLN